MCRASRGAQRAYIFTRDPASDTWQPVARLGLDLSSGGDSHFGEAVAIDGDTVVVGSPDPVGAAYIYQRNQGGPNNWGLVTRIRAHDPWWYGYFGFSVAISGDTTVVGAWGDPGVGGVDVGAAYV
ncbi:MAG: hypothetical protein ACJ8CR_17780, partial [Roseiflexaceae bacterium]